MGKSHRTPAGWTLDTWAYHSEALRAADKELNVEQDRRYSELEIEREKARQIKATADLAALELAQENQNYRDEKAETARERSLSESGKYVTRGDLESVVDRIESSLKPVFDYIATQRGSTEGAQSTVTNRRQEVTTQAARNGNLIAIVAAVISSAIFIVGAVSLLIAFAR